MYVPDRRSCHSTVREKVSDEKQSNIRNKIKIFVLFFSFLFLLVGGWGGGGVRKEYIDGTSQNHRTDAILRRKQSWHNQNEENNEKIVKYLKINTHQFLLFSLFKPVAYVIGHCSNSPKKNICLKWRIKYFVLLKYNSFCPS